MSKPIWKSLATLPAKWVLLLAAAMASFTTIYAFGQLARVRSEKEEAAEEAAIATQTSTASQGDTLETVTALGRLEPEGEIVNLAAPPRMEGTRVEQLLVEEGDFLAPNQTVAVLDSRDRLEVDLARSRAQVEIVRARLTQIEAGSPSGDIDAQVATIERLQAQRQRETEATEAEIERLQAQRQRETEATEAEIERLQAQQQREIESIEAQLLRLRAEAENARVDCDRYDSLYRQGVEPEVRRDSFCLAAETSAEQVRETEAEQYRVAETLQAQIEEAGANRERVLETLQARIEEAEANRNRILETLQAQIEEARGTLRRIEEVRDVDVNVLRAEVEDALSAVRRAEVELAKAYVRAPFAGRVLEVRARAGEVVGTEGIIELGRTDRMYAIAEVYETQIRYVRPGQKATIESDAFSGKLTGIVERIGRKIGKKDILDTDPAADVDARVVEVKIRIDDSDRIESLSNLQVEIEIDIQ